MEKRHFLELYSLRRRGWGCWVQESRFKTLRTGISPVAPEATSWWNIVPATCPNETLSTTCRTTIWSAVPASFNFAKATRVSPLHRHMRYIMLFKLLRCINSLVAFQETDQPPLDLESAQIQSHSRSWSQWSSQKSRRSTLLFSWIILLTASLKAHLEMRRSRLDSHCSTRRWLDPVKSGFQWSRRCKNNRKSVLQAVSWQPRGHESKEMQTKMSWCVLRMKREKAVLICLWVRSSKLQNNRQNSHYAKWMSPSLTGCRFTSR
jgi:hypothetical protein